MHINELFSLENQCAVVIGGAGKIGFSIAEGLGEAGATVIVVSRNPVNYELAVEKLQKAGIKAVGLQLDQANEDGVVSSLKHISDHYGAPKILINSGVERPMTKYFNDSTDNWDSSMRANSRGLFITCRAYANAMANNGGGSIINIASIYGLVAPDPKLYEGTEIQTEPDYPFIKGGMIMFSKYMASKFADKKVRVNVIAPGGFSNNQEDRFIAQYCRKVPLGRMAVSDDIKGAAVFLASEAAAYITGVVLPVDGGFTVI